MSRNQNPSDSAVFLVFEGLDGSGKSTLIQSISAELKTREQRFILTREPGGTPLAEEIRRLLLRTDAEAPVAQTELLLYAASRAQHVAKVIQPALQAGEWVLCDRFTASTISFQCFARGLPREEAEWLNKFAIQNSQPSLTVLLDLTVDESRRRQSHREGKNSVQSDRMERESQIFHENVRQGYLAQAKENPEKWLVLDATEAPEALKWRVLRELESRGWLKS